MASRRAFSWFRAIPTSIFLCTQLTLRVVPFFLFISLLAFFLLFSKPQSSAAVANYCFHRLFSQGTPGLNFPVLRRMSVYLFYFLRKISVNLNWQFSEKLLSKHNNYLNKRSLICGWVVFFYLISDGPNFLNRFSAYLENSKNSNKCKI